MHHISQTTVDVSSYCFALSVTLLVCLLAAGILYIDLCANDTILSARGMLLPWVERWMDFAESLTADTGAARW